MHIVKHILVAVIVCVASQTYGQVMIGHRGSLWGVENTTQSFVNGAQRGYEGLECDIRATADSHFVICHDSDFERVGGPDTPIASMSVEQALAVELSQTRDGTQYTASPILLEDFLDICIEHDVIPVVEIKSCWNLYSSSKDSEDYCYDAIPALLQIIADKGLSDRVVIISFMAGVIDKIRALYPAVQLQFLLGSNADWHSYEQWCIDNHLDIDAHYSLVTDEMVAAFHAAGLRVNAWTVDSPDEFARLQALGVDMVTTNKLPANPN